MEEIILTEEQEKEFTNGKGEPDEQQQSSKCNNTSE